MKFSKSTGCFYPDEIGYAQLPVDAIQVEDGGFEKAMSRASDEGFYVADGKVFIIPAKPDEASEYDESSHKWVVNKVKLSELKVKQLQQEKTRVLEASIKYANSLQAIILSEATDSGQTRLGNKYTAACAIKAGTATAGDLVLIDTEVAMRPKYTKAELVDVIIAKGTAAKQAEGTINAMLLLAQDAIEAAPTLEALGIATKAIMAKADKLKAQLLAQI